MYGQVFLPGTAGRELPPVSYVINAGDDPSDHPSGCCLPCCLWLHKPNYAVAGGAEGLL